jgi:hypothetical protein
MVPWSGTRLGKSVSCEAQEAIAESHLRQAHGTGLLVDRSRPVG